MASLCICLGIAPGEWLKIKLQHPVQLPSEITQALYKVFHSREKLLKHPVALGVNIQNLRPLLPVRQQVRKQVPGSLCVQVQTPIDRQIKNQIPDSVEPFLSGTGSAVCFFLEQPPHNGYEVINTPVDLCQHLAVRRRR